MMELETFKCDDCQRIYTLRKLTRRETMPGQYCPDCGDREKCGACGEVHSKAYMVFKQDVQNYICEDCQHDYKQVMPLIKPLNIAAFRHQPVMAINR